MIAVIHDSDAEFPYIAQLKEYDQNVLSIAYADPPDDSVLYLKLDVLVLANQDAVDYCSHVISKIPDRQFIIMALLPEDSVMGVSSAMQGADLTLVGSYDWDSFIAAVQRAKQWALKLNKAKGMVKGQVKLGKRYILKEVLGVSEHSIVFLADDTKLCRQVTLKLLRNEYQNEVDQLQEFIAKAEQFAKIQDSALVPLIDIGEYCSLPYVVYDIGKAENLYSRARQVTLDEHEVSVIAFSVVKALCAIKDAGFVHLDIKPENILYDKGQYKLIDFGLESASVNTTDFHDNPYWSSPGFSAPEIYVEGEDVSFRSDLFSLGRVLVSLILKRNPFLNKMYPACIEHDLVNDFTFPKNMDSMLSQEMKQVVESMLLFQPDERPCLRDLELIFLQLFRIEDLLRKDLTFGTEDKKSGVKKEEESSELDALRKTRPSGMIRGDRDRATEMARYKKKMQTKVLVFQILSGVLLIVAVGVGILGYFSTQAAKPAKTVHFTRGPVKAMTCEHGHTYKTRINLPWGSENCPKCSMLATPSYRCKDCHIIFGLRNWPEIDMTPEESNAFILKAKTCPVCKSRNIEETPLESAND